MLNYSWIIWSGIKYFFRINWDRGIENERKKKKECKKRRKKERKRKFQKFVSIYFTYFNETFYLFYSEMNSRAKIISSRFLISNNIVYLSIFFHFPCTKAINLIFKFFILEILYFYTRNYWEFEKNVHTLLENWKFVTKVVI